MSFVAASNPKCPTCSKSVYFAERQNGPGGKIYHKGCLKCLVCERRLDSFNLLDREGEPYCKTCYGKMFGPKGYGAGGALVGTYPDKPASTPPSTSPQKLSSQSPMISLPMTQPSTLDPVNINVARSVSIQPPMPEEKKEASNIPRINLENEDFGPSKAMEETDTLPPLQPILPRIVPRRSMPPQVPVKPMLSANMANSRTRQSLPVKVNEPPITNRGGISFYGGVNRKANSDVCKKCGTVVYAAEAVMAAGSKWHKRCLRCSGCSNNLAPSQICEKDELPWCKKCYSDRFGINGQGIHNASLY